jgi:hypothetical protein
MPLLALVLVLQSCATPAHTATALPVASRDNVAPLLKHPQFARAAQVAPEFVEAALKTISRLDRELGDAGR